MTSVTAEPTTIQDWIIALLSARPVDQRMVAIAASDAGYALTPVVCVIHGGTFNGIVGAYRHVSTTEAEWRNDHPEDGENAALHGIGSIRAAVREDAPPPQLPWEFSRCRSCGAEIIWAITSNGKKMPVDVAVNPNGNIQLVAQSLEQSIYEPPFANVIHHVADIAGIEDQLHMSHFVTCPKATEWRRSS